VLVLKAEVGVGVEDCRDNGPGAGNGNGNSWGPPAE